MPSDKFVSDVFCSTGVPHAQVDGVLEMLEFHLDEDLSYKMHWHLEQSKGQIKITEFVEYLCSQHMRILQLKEESAKVEEEAGKGAGKDAPLDQVRITNPLSLE